MFVGDFKNGLKMRHFNESLAQKPTLSMEGIMAMEKLYIKVEDINVYKRMRDAKEWG